MYHNGRFNIFLGWLHLHAIQLESCHAICQSINGLTTWAGCW
jgi:hypothetical protein